MAFIQRSITWLTRNNNKPTEKPNSRLQSRAPQILSSAYINQKKLESCLREKFKNDWVLEVGHFQTPIWIQLTPTVQTRPVVRPSTTKLNSGWFDPSLRPGT